MSAVPGFEGPNKTHVLTALLNHPTKASYKEKRLCTLCCRLHALPDRTTTIIFPPLHLPPLEGTLSVSRWRSACGMFIDDIAKLGSARCSSQPKVKLAMSRLLPAPRSYLPSARLPVHRLEYCVPDMYCCAAAHHKEISKAMRYSRALPRERRPLHNTVQDVGDVHRGEHTLKSRCALCVVRRASCVVGSLARLDGCRRRSAL